MHNERLEILAGCYAQPIVTAQTGCAAYLCGDYRLRVAASEYLESLVMQWRF